MRVGHEEVVGSRHHLHHVVLQVRRLRNRSGLVRNRLVCVVHLLVGEYLQHVAVLVENRVQDVFKLSHPIST